MKKEQEKEWAEAQNIQVSVDLVSAAKNQLKFLAAVDRSRHLYEGPAMERAIYRYNAFWLPLLAKHTKNPLLDDPLVVPLDCEWIWHCHRLNPVRYKSDCERLYGRVLGNCNTISSVLGTSKSKSMEIWSTMYPEEPYEVDYNCPFASNVCQKNLQSENFTSYDLVSAVQRQVPFTYQVSRPHVSDDLFLQEALARYKGFLHLIRTNRKKNIRRFCVPTYDVDLMWHSHQLSPVSYCNDLCKLLGKVLEHDDTDSDRTKGKKLDTGFTETTKQYEDTFGLSYWKAGAMYRGIAPAPVTQIPFPFTYEGRKKFHAPDNCNNQIQIPELKAIEVLLEFVEIKNLPEGHKGDIRVSFSKKQPDKLFNTKKTLTVLSECGQKQVAYFECEPSGEFLFELVCHSPSNIPLPKSFKSFASCSLSLQECLASGSKLYVNKELPVVPVPRILNSKPIFLHVSISFTPPTPVPQVFHLTRSQPFFNGSCLFPLPNIGRFKNAKGRTCVTDDAGIDILSLQMRDLSEDMTSSATELLKEVQCITNSGEIHTVAEFKGNEWSIKGTHFSLKLRRSSGNDGHLFELVGHRLVRLFAGRKLDYEPKYCVKKRTEQDFVTAVEFSSDYPYGRAVALIDFKHGIFKAQDEWMVQSGITLAFILSDILKREGGFTAKVGYEDDIPNNVTATSIIETMTEGQVANGDAGNEEQAISQSGGCGSACGSGCRNVVNSGGCGSACGSGCRNVVDSGGCGSACGSGCRNAVDSGGCGSACGSGCRNAVDSGGCGSPCGSGCRNAVDSGGCGSACGSGCRNIVDSGHMAKCGGCGGGGGCGGKCGGSGSCGGNGASDLPTTIPPSILNEPVAAA